MKHDLEKLRAVLSPTQYKYYVAYVYYQKPLNEIAQYYGVGIPAVCRAIKRARVRVLDYYAREVN